MFRSESIDLSPVASFAWHKAPITSIEWHPTEDSIFGAGAADDQVTLWDLAVEQDNDEVGMHDTPTEEGEVPHQLLFNIKDRKMSRRYIGILRSRDRLSALLLMDLISLKQSRYRGHTLDA